MSMVTATVYSGSNVGGVRIYRNGVVGNAPILASFSIQIGYVHFNDWIEVQESSDRFGTGDFIAFFLRGYIRVGVITATQFVNNNNHRVYIVESAWDTAMANGTVDVQGIIERTHLNGTTGLNIPSLQAEPFGVYAQHRRMVSQSFQVADSLNDLTGGSPESAQCWFVLLVSERVVNHPSHNFTPWQIFPSFSEGIEDIGSDELPTVAFSSYPHAGGHLAGFPLVFPSQSALESFITNLMKSGLKTQRELDPDNTYVDFRDEAGTVMNVVEDGEMLDMQMMYSGNDILGVLYLPHTLCQEEVSPTQVNVNLPLTSNYGKLNTFPYRHFTYVSRAGEELHIIPHNHTAPNGTDVLSQNLPIQHRFVGGMNPYIFTVDGTGECANEYTFDCLSYSIDGFTSSLTQLMSTTQRQFSNVRASINANNGWRMGAGVAGGAIAGAKVGSVVPVVGTAIGAIAGGIIGGVGTNINNNRQANQKETDTLLNASTSSISALQASPSVTSGVPSFVEKLTPNHFVYNGMNNTDLQAYSSTLDTFGEVVNGFGSLRGGGSWGSISVRNFSGQYIQFGSVSNITNAPTRTHGEIISMFIGGVFLV